jgi:trk system potassium uptake protein TrkH
VIDVRPVIFILGLLLTTLGSAMLLPAMVDLALDNDDWQVFAAAASLTLFIGLLMTLGTRRADDTLTTRSAFLLIALVWVALAAFGALPIYWGPLGLDYTDAFFEAMSGITTTGATVIDGLDGAPEGLLLWRALLQWLGGLGVIVMAIAVLPILQVGGMELFKVEAFETPDKILPSAAQISSALTLTFIFFTCACAFAYYAAGMSGFDAVIHAMTTVATGGFSSHDASLGHFDSALIEAIAIVFMVIGSLPFLLYTATVKGDWWALARDSQVRAFFLVVGAGVALALFALARGGEGAADGLRKATFNVVSILTGTGYATSDYSQWGTFAVALFFCTIFIGGCAGSTSCGVKIFRFEVAAINIRQHLNRIIYPNGVFVNTYNGSPLPDHVSASVFTFLFLYFLVFATVSTLLSLLGLDGLTALSAAATALANVGPGLGETIGPEGNFAPLPDVAKWLLSATMLLGRLELVAVLVLFIPSFWRG